MRIACHYCGERDVREFDYHGDATKKRPEDTEDVKTWYDYVYIRSNPAGSHTELWFHVHGCRAWLTVTRNTVNHEFAEVRPTRNTL
jgi:methylglutamate dehydrogenase subunit B